MSNAPKPLKLMLVRCDWQYCFANVYSFLKPGSLVFISVTICRIFTFIIVLLVWKSVAVNVY